MVYFNPEHKKILDSFLLVQPGVKAGKMFGYPAYYVSGKMFACLYENGLGVKVPEAAAKQWREQEDIGPFQPMGKTNMREWIQINAADSNQYLEYSSLLLASIEFVSSQASKRQTSGKAFKRDKSEREKKIH